MPQLHFFRCIHTQKCESVFEDAAGFVREFEAGAEDGLLFAFDTAGSVEAVESGGQVYQVAVDVAGIVVAGGKTEFLAEKRQLLDEGYLGFLGEEGGVYFVHGGDGAAFGG